MSKSSDKPHVLVIGNSGGGKSAEIMEKAIRLLNDPITKGIVINASKKGADQ